MGSQHSNVERKAMKVLFCIFSALALVLLRESNLLVSAASAAEAADASHNGHHTQSHPAQAAAALLTPIPSSRLVCYYVHTDSEVEDRSYEEEPSRPSLINIMRSTHAKRTVNFSPSWGKRSMNFSPSWGK